MNSKSFIIWLLLCHALTLQAQIESHLTFRRYTTQDGLPQMQAERLWQDSHGYIYIGTLSGFVRYDGQTFTPFLKGRRTNIVGFAEIDGEVRAMGFFRQWAVGYDDLDSQPLDPQGHWLLNNLNAGSLPNGYMLMEDSLEQHRRLCLMTRHGFTTLLADTLLDEMSPDRKIFVDNAKDVIIIPTPKGLYQVKGAKGTTVRLSDRGDIYTLLRTKSALLAFASDGIYTVGKDTLKLLAEAEWSATHYGLTVRSLRSGQLIIADEHTLYLYDGSRVHPVFTGLNLIRDILIDRWDRLWVASYQGVYCFFNRYFTNHTLTDESDIVRAVRTGGSGQVVFGTLNGMVLQQDVKGQVTVISNDPEQYYSPSAVRIGQTVYMAGNGDIAAITQGSDGKPALQWLGLPPDRYQFVARAWGRVIAGSRNSIVAYNPETGDTDTLTTEIIHPWCAAVDDKDCLWIGSSAGLFCMTKDRHTCKTDYRQKLIISTMEADHHGTVFFASADSVFIIRNRQVEALNPQIPLLSGHEVRSVHISPRGFLVIAAVDGLLICRVGKDYTLTDTHFYNYRNGFTMTEPLKATMAEGDDGTVWLPGVEQMTSFRPADLLAYHEEDTIISPPLPWWQHWWVWLTALVLLIVLVWLSTRWYEKLRNRRNMIRLQHEKLQKEHQIEAIRQKAIQADSSELSSDIVKMTEQTGPDKRLTFRTASGTLIVDIKDIAFFKGDGNYSQIVTFNVKDTVLTGLGTLEKQLDPSTFVRADRSTLVNIHYISSLLPKQHRCIFRSPSGQEVETTLLNPAFKRLQTLL